MKWIKRLMLAAVLLVAFLMIAMLGIYVLVDPNDYRDEIAAAVKQQTGRDMIIEGGISLSVFPWLGLELNEVRLNNPEGFTDEVFAGVQRVNIKVALMPLLKLETQVGTLELDGLTVNLERRANGKTNWEDLASAAPPPAAQPQDAPPAAEPVPAVDPEAEARKREIMDKFYIGGLDIHDTNVTWRDGVDKVYTRIEDLRFTTGAIRLRDPIKFALEFSVRNDSPKLLAGAKLEGTAGLNLDAELYALENLKLELEASGTMVPGGTQTVQMTVPKLAVAVKEQTVDLQALSLQLAGLNATLDAKVQNFEQDPQVSGKLAADVAQLRGLMQSLGMEVPVTADPAVLGPLKLQLAFKATDNSFDMQNLNVTFDDTHINGALAVNNFASPAYRMNLSADKINADRYLPPPAKEPEPEEETPGDDKVVLPVKELRELKAQGNLEFGELQVTGLKLAKLKAGLDSAGDGLVHLKPLSMEMYEGNFDGAITIDVTGKVPVYKVNTRLKQVQVEPFLQDFMKIGAISGRMNAEFDIETSGNRIRHFKRNLNGTGILNFRDGAFSTDFREKLRESIATFKGKSYKVKPSKPTTFSAIKATLKFDQGTARNDDLEVRASHIHITGKGEYSLPKDTVDYVATLVFSEDPTSQDETLSDIHGIPMKPHLKGKLAELNYKKIMVKAVGDVIEGLAKKEADKKLEKKKDEAKDKLKDKLKDKFKLNLN
jgi:AsmA protein